MSTGPTNLSKPFWDGLAARKLLLQFDGKAYQFYPRPLSLSGTGKLEWKESKGKGVLVAHTQVHTPAEGFEKDTPYAVGIVRLDEGPRIFGRLVGDALKPGIRMRVVWNDRIAGLPFQFEPDR